MLRHCCWAWMFPSRCAVVATSSRVGLLWARLSSAKGKEAEANVEGGVSQVGVDTRPDNGCAKFLSNLTVDPLMQLLVVRARGLRVGGNFCFWSRFQQNGPDSCMLIFLYVRARKGIQPLELVTCRLCQRAAAAAPGPALPHFCSVVSRSLDHQSLPSAFHQLVITGQHQRDLAYSSRNPSK